MFTTKTEIDEYFHKNIKQLCTNNMLPDFLLLLDKHREWYMAIVNGKAWYTGVLEFIHKNNLIFSIKEWSLHSSRYSFNGTIEEYFLEKIVPLMKNKRLPPLAVIKEEWHLGWYLKVSWKYGINQFKHQHKEYFY